MRWPKKFSNNRTTIVVTMASSFYFAFFLLCQVLCDGLVITTSSTRPRLSLRASSSSLVELIGDSTDNQLLSPPTEIIKDFSTVKNVILFDGVCNFCNTWVDLLLRLDTEGKFKLCALQSENGMVR